jgi:hypothetical protein
MLLGFNNRSPEIDGGSSEKIAIFPEIDAGCPSLNSRLPAGFGCVAANFGG